MKRKKVEKLLRELELKLRDEMWLATHPPLFKPGDRVLWYENPCWTSEPEDAPGPVAIIINKEHRIVPGYFSETDHDDGTITYAYVNPHRLYWASRTKKSKIYFSVMEHACYKKGDKNAR